MKYFKELTGTENPFAGINEGVGPSMALADLDNDGDIDLVVGENGGSHFYYQNTGTPAAPVYTPQTGTANPYSALFASFAPAPVFADLDDDDDLDVFMGDGNGRVYYFQNFGTVAVPSYVKRFDVANPLDGFSVRFSSSPAVGDIDGDGDLDLVVGENDRALIFFLNTGTAAQPQYVQQTGTNNPFLAVSVGDGASPALGDMDGDGDLDMVVGDYSTSTLRYYQNVGTTGAPQYVEQTGTANPFGGIAVEWARIALGDIDGDGDLDVVNGATQGALRAYLNPLNSAPVAVDDAISTTEDALLSGNVLNANPTTADSDADGHPLAVTQVNGSAAAVGTAIPLGKGLLTVQATGAFSFNPNGGYNSLGAADTATESFTYTIADGKGGSDTATVTLTIQGANDAPTTLPVVLSDIQEDSGTLRITQAMLLVNASDVDGLAPKAVNLQKTAGFGNLVDNGDGTWSYTPARNDDTDVRFSYSVSDGTASAAGTATLDITPVNDSPFAGADTAVTKMNTAVSIAVLANDADFDGGVLQVVGTTQGNGGSVTIQSGGLTVLYTPNTGFSGFDVFRYTVSDGTGGTNETFVEVLVATAAGTNGNDAMLGTQQVDYIVGFDGDDSIQARAGADYVDGGRGADTISGGEGGDRLLGGDGPDTFVATASELVGDFVDGGNGIDTLVITSALAPLPANFRFNSLELISHNGLVVLQNGAVDLRDFTLAPGSNNKIIGDVGNNTILGTRSDDNISDTAGNDLLLGHDGNDTIQAGVGRDTIYGGAGNDRLCGDRFTSPNDGVPDTFVFNMELNAATNVDQIVGFQANSQDLIELRSGSFGAITGGATPGLDADEFRSVNGGNAQDGNDFIVFDPLTGNLFYDADGSGTGAKVLFATLVGLAGTLDVTDFVGA